MGYQRTVSSKFWEDSKVEEFSPEDRYVLLYMLTNPLTNLCGCYEISMRRMSRDLGYNPDMVGVIVTRLSESGIIEYDHNTSELLICHWSRYNWNASPKLDKPLTEAIKAVKSDRLRERLVEVYEQERGIPYPYRMDTPGIPFTISNTISITKTESAESSAPRCPKCNSTVIYKPSEDAFHCMSCGMIPRSEAVFK